MILYVVGSLEVGIHGCRNRRKRKTKRYLLSETTPSTASPITEVTKHGGSTKFDIMGKVTSARLHLL